MELEKMIVFLVVFPIDLCFYLICFCFFYVFIVDLLRRMFVHYFLYGRFKR